MLPFIFLSTNDAELSTVTRVEFMETAASSRGVGFLRRELRVDVSVYFKPLGAFCPITPQTGGTAGKQGVSLCHTCPGSAHLCWWTSDGPDDDVSLLLWLVLHVRLPTERACCIYTPKILVPGRG